VNFEKLVKKYGSKRTYENYMDDVEKTTNYALDA
jgi:hypothetical protein